MKVKLSSVWRVAIALVMVLTMGLVMAAPVSANVTAVTVANDPQTVSRPATYTIAFTTTASLFPSGGSTITITFLTDTTVPSGNSSYNGTVKVNDTLCSNGTVTGTGLAVTIAVPKDIPAGPVTVVIDKVAGVTNPTTVASTWKLKVHTSAEITDVDSAVYSTIAAVQPEITNIVGTAYQNSNDIILITFSQAVKANDGAWDAGEFTSIKCDTTTLTLTHAVFALDTTKKVLTITLNETTDGAYLVTGGTLKVTPASGKIVTVETPTVDVPITEKTGTISGDLVAPTVALTYSLSRPVKDVDTLTITATFSEAMQATPAMPKIAIDTPGVDLLATDMGGSGKVWTYAYNVPAGSDGTATVTITGKDLAGNSVGAHTTATFVIDNTRPTIAPANIVGTTIQDKGDTIVITFSEAVVPAEATPVWSVNEFSSIKRDTTALTLTNAVFAIDTTKKVLTITLNEATDGAYLVNGKFITVNATTNAINDLALNEMLSGAIVGTTAVSGELVVPTITGIVGVGTTAIKVIFSEAVVPADAAWSSNEFSVESPDGAPLNIANAAFAIDATKKVLTITLNATIDGASLFAGQVILVTPAANAVVDLAGNKLAAVEVTSGGEAGWLAVWVDTTSAPTHFTTIQAAIDAVAAGGTVNVAAGTYTEHLSVGKDNLTIQSLAGAASTIIDLGGYSHPAGIYITASGVTFRGFTVTNIETTSNHAAYAVRVVGSNNTISNNIIVGKTTRDWWNDEEDSGINLDGTSSTVTANNTVENNEIYDFSAMGIQVVGSGGNYNAHDNIIRNNNIHNITYYAIGNDRSASQTIQNNTLASIGPTGHAADGYYGTGIVVWGAQSGGTTITSQTVSGLERGIALASAQNVTVDNCTISSNTVSGVRLSDGGYGAPSNNTVMRSSITNNAVGVYVSAGSGSIGTGNVFEYNNIAGNTNYGMNNTSTTNITATNNWWGDANGPSHASVVAGDNVTAKVVYSPWLDAPYPYGKSTTTTNNYAVNLYTGWNLISLPLIPTNPAITAVLTGVTVNKVWSFNETSQGWTSYIPNGPPGLVEMVDGKGYWVVMNANGMLVVSGVDVPLPPLLPHTYSVVKGWNLVGFKSTTAKKASDYLLAIDGKYTIIYGFDAEHQYYVTVQSGQDLEPGKGYWIAITAAEGTIYP